MRLMLKFQGAVRELTDAPSSYLQAKSRFGLGEKEAAAVTMLATARSMSTERLIATERGLVRNEKNDPRLRALVAVMLAETVRGTSEATDSRALARQLTKDLPTPDERRGFRAVIECLQMMRRDVPYEPENFCSNVEWLLMFPQENVVEMAIFAMVQDLRPRGDRGRAQRLLNRVDFHLARIPGAKATLEEARQVEEVRTQLRFV